jgi:phosphatidylglycerol:prolipoprotein diacylglycerol transferase
VIPFLHFGWLTIPTFGLMVATAMLVAYFVLREDLARRGIAAAESGVAESFIAIPCIAGIVGAKLYHVLETPRELLSDPLGQIFSQFGFAWFGGLLAGMAAFIILARRNRIPLLVMLDAGSAAAALGYGIGRIGCFLSGDGDYGIPTSLPWGMSFPHGLVPTDVRVHPTPIYELVVACWIAWVLWRLGHLQAHRAAFESVTVDSGKVRVPISNRSFFFLNGHQLSRLMRWLRPGGVFAAYLVLTGAARFLVEFIRINPRTFLGMSNAQAASLGSIALGAALWWWLWRKEE